MTNLPIIAQPVRWERDSLRLLDQRLLPSTETYVTCESSESVVEAIRTMVVRGAPAIGIAAAYGVALHFKQEPDASSERTLTVAKALTGARPTAINLKWAVNRVCRAVEQKKGDRKQIALDEAKRIHEEDIANNRVIAELGAELLSSASIAMTHCNAGDLATGGIGTAVGVIRRAFATNRISHVYTCETRPLLQGLRLTSWELKQAGIPFTSICDNMAGAVMLTKNVGAVLVGADRIAANGDTANKIGTYGLAVLARFHKIPFYVVAPRSTFDLTLSSGRSIPIEERSSREILDILGPQAPEWPTFNPGFDVTPANLITAIVCEAGVIREPTESKIAEILL